MGEELVPIQLDLLCGSWRLRDSFLWNLYESTITPEEFARQLVTELDFPIVFVDPVATSIREQIKLYEEHLKR